MANRNRIAVEEHEAPQLDSVEVEAAAGVIAAEAVESDALRQIAAWQSRVDEATLKRSRAKDALKAANAEVDTEVAGLGALIHSLTRHDPLLKYAAKPADSDDWRAVGLEALQLRDAGITDKHLEKLRDAGLPTVGELAARMEDMGTDWAKGMRFGEPTRQWIEDAVASIRAEALSGGADANRPLLDAAEEKRGAE